MCCLCFFFQAEDGIRDLVRSRGLGDVYKRQAEPFGLVNLEEDVDGYVRRARPAFLDESPVPRDLSLIHI